MINKLYKVEADNASMFLIFANQVTEELKEIPESAKCVILNPKVNGAFLKDFSSKTFYFYIFIRPDNDGNLSLPALNHELLHFTKWLSRLESNKAMDEELIRRGYPKDKTQEEKECNILGTVSSFYYRLILQENIPTTYNITEDNPHEP